MLRALLMREPKRKDICGEACAFTGHRPQKLPFGFNEEDPRCIALKAVIETQIVNHIAVPSIHTVRRIQLLKYRFLIAFSENMVISLFPDGIPARGLCFTWDDAFQKNGGIFLPESQRDLCGINIGTHGHS